MVFMIYFICFVMLCGIRDVNEFRVLYKCKGCWVFSGIVVIESN